MKAEKKKKHRIDSLYPKYLLIPVVLVFVVFFILPVIGGVFISFTNWDITRSGIRFVGLDNYVSILRDSSVQKAIKNTVIFTISIVLLRNVFALALAVALCKNLKTKTYLRTVFYIPAILSYVVVGIMFNALFQMDGTINQILQMLGIECTREWVASADTALFTVIVEDIWKWTGFHMIIYIAGITAIPQDFYEASRIDGASSWKQFWYLTFPLLTPALTVNITQSVIGGFRVFEQVLTLTKGGPGHESTVVGMMIYEYFGRGFYGKSTAITMLLSVVVVFVTIFLRKFFASREVSY